MALGGGGGGEGAFGLGCGGDGSLAVSLTGAGSALGLFSALFPSLEGDGLVAVSVAPSSDFEMAAILTPGSTVSPSLAKSYYQLNAFE